jgi:hypothetical protein
LAQGSHFAPACGPWATPNNFAVERFGEWSGILSDSVV